MQFSALGIFIEPIFGGFHEVKEVSLMDIFGG